jgi:hypothetical protein
MVKPSGADINEMRASAEYPPTAWSPELREQPGQFYRHKKTFPV